MLKCLVSENDTVVETFLSESVLEEEYLQEEVRGVQEKEIWTNWDVQSIAFTV